MGRRASRAGLSYGQCGKGQRQAKAARRGKGEPLRLFRQGSWWFLYSKGGGSTKGPMFNKGVPAVRGSMVASSCSTAANGGQHR